MADHDQEQKTEQPTEKRLNEAHERGQFAKSHELTVLFALVAFLAAVGFTAQAASRDIADYATSMFSRFASTPVASDTVMVPLSEALLTTGRALAPFLLGIAGATLLAGGVQSGFRLSPNAVMFKLDSLDVTKGFGREADDRARFDAANQACFEQQRGIFWRISLFSPEVDQWEALHAASHEAAAS
jgi:flagellar biosynthetic protein FlhB